MTESTAENGMESRGERREEGVAEIWEDRVFERRPAREGGEKETSRWSECCTEREWDWEWKGEITLKWWRGWEAEERKDERREGASEGNGPMRRRWRETGMEREMREEMREGMWGWGRWEERDFLREEGRERKESLVAWGSPRDCWARKESKPRIGAAEVVIMVVLRKRKMKAPMVLVVGIFGGKGRASG